MMLTKQMRTGKCWFEKGDFDHFWMCFGCFRAQFGPGGVPKTAPARHFEPGASLKQPQHVKKVKTDADQKDAHWKMLVSTGDFDHFRMCFGCFRAHFGPGGGP